MKFNKTPGLLGLAALAVLASPAAFAQETGWYGGGNIGQSRATIDNARVAAGLAQSGFATTSIADRERDAAYKLYGGYRFTPYFSVEGGYFDLGKFGFTANTVPAGSLNGNIRIRGFNLDLVGTVPLTEKLSALGRVGANYAQAKDSFRGSGAVNVINPNPSERATNYKVGLGLQYAFSDDLAMRAEIERYRINDAVGNRGHVDMVSVGLVYSFGGKAPTYVPRAAAPEPVVMAATPVPMPPPVMVAPPAPPPPYMPTKVTFSADSLFDFDKSTVRPEGKQALDKFSNDLKGTQYEAIKVTGHTDRLGSHAYNLKLSSRRAEAVSAYLTTSAGIPASKITATGVDGADPVTKPGECVGNKPTAKLIACLQPDRRVEIEVSGTK
ncbi:MAG: OmpA family protein [Pseudomonadota bacterium]